MIEIKLDWGFSLLHAHLPLYIPRMFVALDRRRLRRFRFVLDSAIVVGFFYDGCGAAESTLKGTSYRRPLIFDSCRYINSLKLNLVMVVGSFMVVVQKIAVLLVLKVWCWWLLCAGSRQSAIRFRNTLMSFFSFLHKTKNNGNMLFSKF